MSIKFGIGVMHVCYLDLECIFNRAVEFGGQDQQDHFAADDLRGCEQEHVAFLSQHREEGKFEVEWILAVRSRPLLPLLRFDARWVVVGRKDQREIRELGRSLASVRDQVKE